MAVNTGHRIDSAGRQPAYGTSSPAATAPSRKAASNYRTDTAQPLLASSRPLARDAARYGQCGPLGVPTHVERIASGSHRIPYIDVCVQGLRPAMRFGKIDELDRARYEAIQKVVPAVPQVLVKGLNGHEWSGSSTVLNPAEVARYFPGMRLPSNTFIVHTNHHVADGAREIVLSLPDGRRLKAEVMRAPNGEKLLDEQEDTALLIVQSDAPLPMAHLVDARRLRVGETIFAAGYPLGVPRVSVTQGIVSQPEQLTGNGRPDIQSDAAINPGNSGGPAFDRDGRVVGTNTYTFRGANDMSFVVPIHAQLGTLSQIWTHGAVARGDIGVELAPLGLFERNQAGLPAGLSGATIESVRDGSQAAKLRLKRGDILAGIRVLENGRVVERIAIDCPSPFHLTLATQAIQRLRPGQQVQLDVYRKRMKLGAVSYEHDEPRVNVLFDRPRVKTEGLAWGFTAQQSRPGELRISTVAPGSPAAQAGLKPGWILMGVRAREVQRFQPQPMRNAGKLHDLLGVLRERGTTEMILELRHPQTGQMQRIRLVRPLGSDLFSRRETTSDERVA